MGFFIIFLPQRTRRTTQSAQNIMNQQYKLSVLCVSFPRAL